MSKKENVVVNPNSVNRIANTTKFVGDVDSESDIAMDGKLEGKLKTKGKLVLGAEGVIVGEVYCKSAGISGKIEGKVFVEDIITLQSSAVVNGEITTNKLAIEPGAVFNGTCNMKGSTKTTTGLSDKKNVVENQ